MNIIRFKKLYLYFSIILLLPGVISLFVFGLNLSIDFTGGAVSTYKILSDQSKNLQVSNIEALQNSTPNLQTPNINVQTNTIELNDQLVSTILQVYKTNQVRILDFNVSDSNLLVKTDSLDNKKNIYIKEELSRLNPSIFQVAFENVGPAVSKKTTKNALVAIFWASIGILFFIAFAFRNIPNPYSSFNFGISAIVAMLHDALFLFGIFSILGKFYNIEIDQLFITAVLTVIGFSVHDTIVVFDRIRENLLKLPKSWNFDKIANYSLVETLSRSYATSLTVIFTLFSLYILGGESIKNFVLALLLGVIVGTYSSVFVATPLLVYLEEIKKAKKSNKTLNL